MVGGEHSLKMSASQLLRFGIDSVLKILNKRITQLINQSINQGRRCLQNSPGYTRSVKYVRDLLSIHKKMGLIDVSSLAQYSLTAAKGRLLKKMKSLFIRCCGLLVGVQKIQKRNRERERERERVYYSDQQVQWLECLHQFTGNNGDYSDIPEFVLFYSSFYFIV